MTKLITNGLVLDHRYYLGDFKDYSGNGNDGTPSSGVTWKKNPKTHALYEKATGRITVADSPELQTDDELTLVFFGEFTQRTGNNRFINKRDGGGNNYGLYVANETTTTLTAATSAAVTMPWAANKKMIALAGKSGTKLKGYLDGVYQGESAGNLVLAKDDAPLLIGSYYTHNYGVDNPLSAVLIYNRQLSAAEISQLNAWGNEQISIHKQKEIKNYPLDTAK